MEKKTPANTKPKTLAFINVDIQVQAANGEWYSFKGGIPITDRKASERGLAATPNALDDPEKIKVTAALHVIAEEPEEVNFS